MRLAFQLSPLNRQGIKQSQFLLYSPSQVATVIEDSRAESGLFNVKLDMDMFGCLLQVRMIIADREACVSA